MQEVVATLVHPDQTAEVVFTKLANDRYRETFKMANGLQAVNAVFSDCPIHGRPGVLANKLARYYRLGYLDKSK